MKYLTAVLILCLGVTVYAAPALELEDDYDVAINVTLIPNTTEGTVTINPASDKTVSAASMPPASGQTDTAPTIGPMSTTGSAIPVTIITLEPTTPATIVPIVTTLKTLPTEKPTPEPQAGFDGASFGGGIALGVGLCVIFLIAFKVYARRRQGGYRTM